MTFPDYIESLPPIVENDAARPAIASPVPGASGHLHPETWNRKPVL
jgi:hypothetical protein